MSPADRSHLLELVDGLEARARQVRQLASTRLNPAEVSRLASKASAYAHAAELLREALERCE